MASTEAPLTLVTLPEEILHFICLCLDTKSLIDLAKTARRFAVLSNHPLLWKAFCQNEFQHWSSRATFHQLLSDPTYQDWKTLYKEQHMVSQSTRNILKDIVRDTRGRSDRIQTIVEQGYRAKSALLKAFHESPGTPNHLAQRYWSHVALGCLHRSMALEEWTRIKYRTDVDRPTERSLAAFDLFVLDERDRGDIDDVFDRLDSYAESVRLAYPDLNEQTPRTRAMAIASHLRDRHWVGIDPGPEFDSLDNMFLGVALFSPDRNALPLISAVIYSYVARQFNLQAQPINYPVHVHVLVRPPEGVDLDNLPLRSQQTHGSENDKETISSKTHLYMDPFHSAEPVSIPTLEHQLRFLDRGRSAAQSATYLSAATHRDLLIRCANNILRTSTVDGRTLPHPLSVESATYAALFALVLFPTHPASLRTQLTQLTQHFLHHYDHDIHIFRTYILPLTTNLPDHLAYRNLSLQLLRNDHEGNTPKYRSPDPTGNLGGDGNVNNIGDDGKATTATSSSSSKVQYRVGQLFRHRRRNYLGLIYGWDATCEMTPQWISMNQVDGLPRGRHQPFYNVLVIDDRSTRYVAEENVVLLGPIEHGGNGELVTAREVDTWPIEIGRWMKRFDVQRRRRQQRPQTNSDDIVVVNDDNHNGINDNDDGQQESEGGSEQEGIGWSFVSNVRDEYPED